MQRCSSWVFVGAIPLLFLGFACTPLQAASIELGGGGCDIKLSGEIVEGDAAKLRAALSEAERLNALGEPNSRLTLCLDSPGGSFTEALEMIDAMRRSQESIFYDMSTYVDAETQCYSACALVFLAGSSLSDYDIEPFRTMHVRAKLGLHAPFGTQGTVVSQQAADAYFKAGMSAVTKLMKTLGQELLPDSLRLEMLAHMGGGSDVFEIDTIDKAGRWNIGLAGYEPARALTTQLAMQGCSNKRGWTAGYEADEVTYDDSHEAVDDVEAPRPISSDTTKDGVRRLVLFSDGPLSDCIISAQLEGNGLLLDIRVGENIDKEEGVPGETPSWYLFSPTMMLAMVPAGPGNDLGTEIPKALDAHPVP
jgi:hypothetical protein